MIEENNLEIDELNQSDEQIILETPAKDDEGEIVPSDNEALIKSYKINQQQQKVLDFSVPPRNIIGGTTATNIAGGLVTGGDGNFQRFSTPPPNFPLNNIQQPLPLSSSSQQTTSTTNSFSYFSQTQSLLYSSPSKQQQQNAAISNSIANTIIDTNTE
uniref:Uncharacterized protein n=1 Tax=Meloidogyne floridensis TaxID=298350 RepID=A0A915NNE1_9BILA